MEAYSKEAQVRFCSLPICSHELTFARNSCGVQTKGRRFSIRYVHRAGRGDTSEDADSLNTPAQCVKCKFGWRVNN